MSDGLGPPATEPVDRTASSAQRDEQFASFYRDAFSSVAEYLILLGARRQDAIDVAQETLIKARREWLTIDHPQAWCRRVAARAWWRRMGRAREVPVDVWDKHTGLLAVEVPQDPADTITELDEIHTLVWSLPARQREVFAWSLAGFSGPEIAIQMRISEVAVRKNLSRARRALSERITLEGGW